jgi:pimeloyl-ACP methyl ester carboxylesterase
MIRAAGHEVHTPTIKGNGPEDPKHLGLAEAIASISGYLTEQGLTQVALVGHSYGGMIITGVADTVSGRLRRLVYWNAFVPEDGERLIDMIPPEFAALFDAIAAQRGDGCVVVLPFPIWRQAFMNDADLDTAERAYRVLNPHPLKTLTDKISLKTQPAQDRARGDDHREVVRQLHRGHLAAASSPVAPAIVAKAGPVSADSGVGQPRALLFQPRAAGSGDLGRGTRLARQATHGQ